MVIGAKRGHHLFVLEQRDADERCDLPCPERRAVVIAESLVGFHIADNDSRAALEGLAHRLSHTDLQGWSDEWLDAAGVLAVHPVLAAVEFRITDAGNPEVLAKMSCGSLLDGGGVAQRAERVVQHEKKRQPLFVRAQFGFRLAVLERRPGPIGDFLHQGNFVDGPYARRAVVNAERGDETAVLDQQRTDVGPDRRRLQRRPLLGRVRLGRCVVDRQRPSFQDVCRTTAAHIAPLHDGRLTRARRRRSLRR